MSGSLSSSPETTLRPATVRALPVLVAVGDAALARRVIEALDGERFDVQVSGGSLEDGASPDVIITDQTLASDVLAPFHANLMHGEVGVVLIGRTLPADVLLSADFTRRELRLTVRMLAQVAGLRRQNRRLAQLASTDPLTSLPNRRAIEERFAEWRAAAMPMALALFDLDDFKRVNAEFGYLRGDEVLRAAAKTLAARAREQFVARLGGDEFVLLWSAAEREDAAALAEDCRRAVGAAASLKAERPLSASAGVAVASEGDDFLTLLAAADAALRRAKEAGGKRTETIAENNR